MRVVRCLLVAGVFVVLMGGGVLELAVASGGAADLPYVVILRDGRTLRAKRKPVSAFGKVRYVDGEGRTKVIKASAVDLNATRAANADVKNGNGGGTLSISGSAGSSTKPNGAGTGDAQVTGGSEKPKPSKKVTVYSATWCTYCKQLKSFLRRHGVSATIIEVDTKSPGEQQRLKAEMRRLSGGRASFPLVIVGDAVKVGYNEAWLRSQLDL